MSRTLIWLSVLAVFAGFCGGFVADKLCGGEPAYARKPKIAKAVMAEEFQVVDAKGKIHALLKMVPEQGPGLFLQDASGKARAMIALSAAGDPTVALADKEGHQMGSFTVTGADGSPLGAQAACLHPRAERSP